MRKYLYIPLFILTFSACSVKKSLIKEKENITIVDTTTISSHKEVEDKSIIDTNQENREDLNITIEENIVETRQDSTKIETRRIIVINKSKRDTISSVVKSDIRLFSDDLKASNTKMDYDYQIEEKVSKKSSNGFIWGVIVSIGTIILFIIGRFYLKRKLFL